ncbi:MAG: imidazole glycerol phosphate synthase subunit HisH [Rhodospirillaceae bacterium]|jgi:imidazole glycerol-phosphate synthase subunit HisH|nr:imidazole glycerol phosphate synthase subunit HisH [Rhodospirillaceae bacterium]MBT6136848.1 imidazole glycerol phosphate synthase subunit HisH [Rhodospirillaceae bacterium]
MSVVIVDYGSGNLRSAAKAFERAASESSLNMPIKVTAAPKDIAQASHVVLPGVGAYADCRAGLGAIPGMIEALAEHAIQKARPFLGICVGMQLMAEAGFEHGRTDGLGWIKGEVRALKPAPNPDGRPLKVPHMGWNRLGFPHPGHPLLDAMGSEPYVYFVHGYHMQLRNPDETLAETDYGGSITAMIGRDNLAGTQFHPEKSQTAGLRLIANFLAWRP